jgi:aminoglycoside phosphotransferase (APT) family kinase protein
MASHLPVLAPLLAAAGLDHDVRTVRELRGGWTNQNVLVELVDGQRYVLRVYRWPHGEGSDRLQRSKKEAFLHRLLSDHGVRVPKIVAQIEDDGQAASLLQYLPGELLGDAGPRLTSPERGQAWRSVGAALYRAHQIHYPPGSHGDIVGDVLQPFEAGSWGRFHVQSIVEHAERLRQREAIRLDLSQLRQIVEATVPKLDRTPASLLHNDPHPWNVLVRREGPTWECSGWLDWEYAWVGDPDWDLVRMDLFRIRPIGPTPSAFYDGYGSTPATLPSQVYTLHINLWMANDFLNGGRTLLPTYQAAMAYLGRMDRELEALDRSASRE